MAKLNYKVKLTLGKLTMFSWTKINLTILNLTS
jgi:hypothetical protein